MQGIILISFAFLLISQSLGLLAYYSKRNQYSKSAQHVATFLPSVVFVLLTVAGTLLSMLLAWWVEEKDLRSQLLSVPPMLVVWYGLYLVGGAIVNIFLSIVVQLVILVIYPPPFKSRRRHRSRESADIVG